MKEKIIKYSKSLISALIIALFFFILPNLISSWKPFAPVFMSLGGLLFTIPIRFWWQVLNQPILVIKDKPEPNTPEPTEFHLGPENEWEYAAHRILVENKGKSAAKNCKAWRVEGDAKLRVCWTVPEERPNATINPGDCEEIDFCAYYVEGPESFERPVTWKERQEILSDKPHPLPVTGQKSVLVPEIIAPTENGWMGHPGWARDITELKGKDCQLLVTSENAESKTAQVSILEDGITVTGEGEAMEKQIKDNTSCSTSWVDRGVLIVLALTLVALVWQTSLTRDEIDLMKKEINLMGDEIKVRQRPFFGLIKPGIEYFRKDTDPTKHEIAFIFNFENSGPVPANDVTISQEYFLIKEDEVSALISGKKPKGEPVEKTQLASGISILPHQVYPISAMTHLKTLKDTLSEEFGEPTKPGYLYIHTDVKYRGMQMKPEYFQDTVYLFRWFPAHAEKEVFSLLGSKSN